MSRTDIFKAAWTGNVQSVRAELAAGADPNAFHKGQNALMLACEKGHRDVLELLLNNGTKINAVDTYNRTALYLATQFGHLACVSFLLQRGASTEVRSSLGGECPMDIAKMRSNIELQRLLSQSPPQSPIQAKVGGKRPVAPAAQPSPQPIAAAVALPDVIAPVALSFNRKAPAPEIDETIRPEPLVHN